MGIQVIIAGLLFAGAVFYIFKKLTGKTEQDHGGCDTCKPDKPMTSKHHLEKKQEV